MLAFLSLDTLPFMFTYVRVMQHAPEKSTGEDGLPVPPYTLYNIGNNHLENLLDFVQILQEELVPMQAGDVPVTYADTSALERDFGFKPSTPLRIDERQG